MNLGNIASKLSSGITIPLEDSETYSFAVSCDIYAISRQKDEIASCYLKEGIKTACEGFTVLKDKLQQIGNWKHTGRDLLVNMDQVFEVKPIDADEYLLITRCGREFRVSPYYAEQVRKYYDVKTLQHVTPFSLPNYWMMKFRIRKIEKNILYMEREELFEEFASASGDVVISDLITNFLWQQVSYIRQGNESPVDGGNVRSLWYLIKPVIYRIQPKPVRGVDHYKTLSEKIAQMVSHKIFSYSEFGLYEYGFWSIGKKNPHIILMSEKDSHYNFLLKMQEELGVTIISSGGQPKTISSEYFSKAFRESVPDYFKKGVVRMISLVDYDPFGWLLLDTLIDDLRVFGIKHIKVKNLSVPENYLEQELKYQHFDLIYEGNIPDTILKRWMKKTNGIDGNTWGMEVDVLMMRKKDVRELILKEIK